MDARARVAYGRLMPAALHQRFTLLFIVAFGVAAAAGPPVKSELAFAVQPSAARLIVADGRASAEKITRSGAFPAAVSGRKGGIAVEYQRHAVDAILAGLVAHDPRLIDDGLRALEWGFAQAGTDGSFPTERGGTDRKQNALHPKAVFLAAAAHSILLIRRSDADARFKVRAEALVPRLLKSARWMMASDDLAKFFRRAGNTNQLFSAALALHEASLLGRDAALAAAAREKMVFILARQTPDGTFPEKGGFDASYQSLSLEFLARYALSLAASRERETALAALRRGVARLVRIIRTDGTIDTRSNTRTEPCGPPVRGNRAKGRDIDILPRRLHLFAYVLDEPRLGTTAELTLAAGQRFGHIGRCGEGKGTAGSAQP
jgi:hypothetical protein